MTMVLMSQRQKLHRSIYSPEVIAYLETADADGDVFRKNQSRPMLAAYCSWRGFLRYLGGGIYRLTPAGHRAVQEYYDRNRERSPFRRLKSTPRHQMLEEIAGVPPGKTRHWRPLRRGECPISRPCPYVTCKYHLRYNVTELGKIVLQHPHLALEEMDETCALDVAARGEHSLQEVGAIMNLTYERVRQIELEALAKLRAEIERLRRDGQ